MILIQMVLTSIKLLETSKSDSEKYEILTDLLTYVDDYVKYKAVALLIGMKNIKKLPISEPEIKAKIFTLEDSVNSMDVGAKILLKKLNDKTIYILPR